MIESAGGCFAIGTQILYLTILTATPYGLAFGLKQCQKNVLSLGMCSRNIGAVLAPLYATRCRTPGGDGIPGHRRLSVLH
jgi:hypothetical protein